MTLILSLGKCNFIASDENDIVGRENKLILERQDKWWNDVSEGGNLFTRKGTQLLIRNTYISSRAVGGKTEHIIQMWVGGMMSW